MNLYHVDCPNCGSYRTAGGTDLMMRMNDQGYRDRMVAQVKAANAHGLRYDLISSEPAPRPLFRIEPGDSTSLILVYEPRLGEGWEWRAKHIGASGVVDHDEPIDLAMTDPTRDEAIAILTNWWRHRRP